MGDVITRFKLETSQFDSKLRDESKRLADIARQASLAGNEFGKFANKNTEAAKALGNMATSATNSKDKVKELVGAYNDLAKEYNSLTKAQQQEDFAKGLAQSLETLKGRIHDAKQELYSMGDAVKKVKADAGGMDQLMGGIAGQFGVSPMMATGVGAAVATAGIAAKAISDNINTAMNFEKSMSALSALTGMVGKDLDTLKEYAIELGSTTTLTASQVADAFRLIGSQQPQLLSSGEALKEVTKYAITLSEAAGIDLATASQTLSTSINQMGGDSANAARYVNVLAAASQKGAGDIAWLGEAVVKSGTYAKAVGASYEDLVANLETLAKAGYDASTAGTALRSIILALEKQADSDLKPSVVGLTEAFANLGTKQLDISGYAALVNQRFAAQAMTLAENAQQTRDMTEAITGTNIAEQQAETNVNNLSGALKQLESAWEGLNLHINDSNSMLTPLVNGLSETVRQVDSLVSKIMELKTQLEGHPLFRLIEFLGNKGMQMGLDLVVPGGAGIRLGKAGLDLVAPDPAKQQQQRSTTPYDRNTMQNPIAGRFISTMPAGYGGAQSDLKNIEEEAQNAVKGIKELENEIKTLKKLRDEAANKGNTALRDQYNTQIKAAQAELKTLRGGTTSTPKGSKAQTPQDKAANIVDQAQQNYAQTLTEASMRMEAGLDDTLAYKKKELQAQEQLFGAYGKAYATYADPKYKDAYDAAAEAYKKMAGEVASTADEQAKAKEAAKALAAAEKRLADAQEKLAAAEASGDYGDIVKARKEVSESQLKLRELNGGAEPLNTKVAYTVEVAYTQGNMADFTSELKKKINQAELGSELYNNLTAQLADATALGNLMQTAVQNGIDVMQFNPQELWKKVFGETPGDYIDDADWQGLVDKINEHLKELGIEPIKIDFQTGGFAKEGQTASKSWQAAAQAVQSVGSALQQIQDPSAKVAGIIGQAIAQIALGFAQATAASTGGGIFGWIAAVAGGLATMISTIEAIKSATHYATGGIVPGHDYTDNTPVMVSSGELILNRAQTNTVAALLEGGGSQSSSSQPYVQGEQIWLGLSNYIRRSGRGEIVTSR